MPHTGEQHHENDQNRPDKLLFVYSYNPHKRLIQLVARTNNEIKDTSRVQEVIRNFGIATIYSMEYVEKDPKVKAVSIVGETKENFELNRLKSEIESIPFVFDCYVTESNYGFLVDNIRFPLKFNDEQRIIIMRQQGLSNMFRNLRESFGSGANVILFKEGYTLGKSAAESILSMTSNNFVKDNFVDTLHLFSSVGWARPELVKADFQNSLATIRLHDNFECAGQVSDKQFSHFVRGDLCGFVSVMMRAKLNCVEEKCIAKGDGYCEFVLSKV